LLILAERSQGSAMKHAVVIAHPNSYSLTRSAAEAYAEAARALGHGVLVRDLYAMKFDPLLRAEEIPQLTPPTPGPDVAAERAVLADVDVFAFVYPFWFNAPPAILKGYVDRVFGMGFGYAPVLGGGTEPLLEGRRLISFSFSGAPEQWVQQTGALRALMSIFDGHLAQMCGLELVDHIHTGGVAPNMTEEAVAEILARVRETVSTLFGADALRTVADLL
jgi:NAD(P)H dehydrogenase (quinone)